MAFAFRKQANLGTSVLTKLLQIAILVKEVGVVHLILQI